MAKAVTARAVIENYTYTDLAIVYSSPQSRLWLCSGFFVDLRHLRPNWWWRIWHRIFFGFRWETLVEKE